MYVVLKRRHLLLAGALALVLAAIPIAKRAAQPAVPAGASVSEDWGLHFEKDGEPPVGNASAKELLQYGAYYLGDPSEKKIYLTFDAGYEAGYTAKILDTLKAHGAPAAFFVVGNYLETAPDLVQRMAAEGHTVGNHTYHHYDMSQIAGQAAFSQELESVETLYTQITGKPMEKVYRPPQGKYSVENLKQAQALGYHTIFWSLAYVDWLQDDQPDPDAALQKLLSRTHPGAVVLLHCTSKTNAEILDPLLTQWEQAGYTLAPLSDLYAAAPASSG